MKQEVYVVHCIDTEGPLYESLEATFKRLEEILDIRLEPTKENLLKLQNKEIDLHGKEITAARIVDNSLLRTYGNWDEVEVMIDKILNVQYREKLLDSRKQGWKYSWFCMDHMGFWGDNPRRRITGNHSIYDWYVDKYNGNMQNDIIQWHYHPQSLNGNYHSCGMNYVSSSNIFEILSKKIIDRFFFPATFRPGFHTERPDSHWFLEQWVPFDYGNQAMKEVEEINQNDLGAGRFGNWVTAPCSWTPYHPSQEDYRKVGDCNRWIARCLNMNTRVRTIQQEDVDDAFQNADKGTKQLLAFTDHDFRDISYDIDLVRNMIDKSRKLYPNVKFYYSNAIEGIRSVLDLKPCAIDLIVEYSEKLKRIFISSNCNMFGVQPFFCFKTFSGQYIWSNLDFLQEYHWSYTFDHNSIEAAYIEKIGIAANSKSGVTELIVFDMVNKKQIKKILNSK